MHHMASEQPHDAISANLPLLWPLNTVCSVQQGMVETATRCYMDTRQGCRPGQGRTCDRGPACGSVAISCAGWPSRLIWGARPMRFCQERVMALCRGSCSLGKAVLPLPGLGCSAITSSIASPASVTTPDPSSECVCTLCGHLADSIFWRLLVGSVLDISVRMHQF